MATVPTRLSTALSDRYAIKAELGRGGMATVYLAEDLKHHRDVAVKVLLPELAAVLGPDRFLREIEIAAQLTHPHILPLHDSGESDGFLYYVMPYVRGESLRDKLNREKQLGLDEAVEITTAVARALDHAHRNGVLHRDIKPENILLHDGEAVVADFGIALALTEAAGTRLTETGLSLGTPSYMSPEQATGDRRLDARTDVYSLASVLYEMLAGDPPFMGSNVRAVIAKVIGEKPTQIRTLRDSVPQYVESALEKALAKVPADRFASAAEFANALRVPTGSEAVPRSEPVQPRLKTTVRSKTGRRPPAFAAIVVLVVVSAVALSGWLYNRMAKIRWARTVAIPEVVRLRDARNYYDAFHLALEAERYLPDDALLVKLKLSTSLAISVNTTPEGSDVFYADYPTVDDPEWTHLGRTPIDSVLVPATYYHLRMRIEKPGFDPLLVGFNPWPVSGYPNFPIYPAGTTPDGMVRVPDGRDAFPGHGAVEVGPHWIDKYEVTNEAFLTFVNAGGYERREYWESALDATGGSATWENIASGLRDETGRRGPATWQLGSYPDGEADFPVRGISWYEAAAYCQFVGKSLPTTYHWRRAAEFSIFSDILLLSNIGGSAPGPAAIRTHQGVGPHGTFDMAGNVKEWTWNATDDGRRFILGGAWNEPDYMFMDLDAQAPELRNPTFGFRCAQFDEPVATNLTDPIARTVEDPASIRPVSEEIFEIYRALYAYDPTPLNALVETIDTSSTFWREELISFDAAYGNERVLARLFLPRTGSPPYQTVVYFPGGSAFRLPSSQNIAEMTLMEFVPRTGRALMYPVYKATYERRLTAPLAGRSAARDLRIQWRKDLGRSIDYLATRDDIDVERLAYIGTSVGASVGPIMTALEDRFKVSVFFLGGLVPPTAPETDQRNFAPRSTLPTLMVNGRSDFVVPFETSQVPLFELLGTPTQDKRHLVLEGGHMPFDQSAMIRAALEWLDKYLGPVPQ